MTIVCTLKLSSVWMCGVERVKGWLSECGYYGLLPTTSHIDLPQGCTHTTYYSWWLGMSGIPTLETVVNLICYLIRKCTLNSLTCMRTSQPVRWIAYATQWPPTSSTECENVLSPSPNPRHSRQPYHCCIMLLWHFN